MRVLQLQLLTWGTATAAISSAVWLSSTDQAAIFCSTGYRAASEALELDLPAEPTRAGPARASSEAGSQAAKARLTS